MSSADLADPVLNEAADLLQQQLIYNGEVLDIAFESLRVYKPGTQSLAYLDSSIHLAYALLKMLERWGKARGGDNMYVRKKSKKKNRANGPWSISLVVLIVFSFPFRLKRCRRGK
jgi:replication fork protection complex subunit Tof1/Swi1